MTTPVDAETLGRLRRIEGFLLDMDGTIYLGDRLLPGAHEFLDLLETSGRAYLFLTNNSSSHGGVYAAKLRRLGLDVGAERVFTSGEATARYLKERHPGARIYLVGTPALEEEFATHGFQLVCEDPEYVVLGFDTTLTYEKLWRLCDFVRAGFPYIATHPDINCPTESGFMPDIGAIMAAVAASTGRHADVIIGKPYPPMVEAVVSRTGLSASQLCMVGDRLYTDIALGQAGVLTVLVLTGETRAGDLVGSVYQPDLVVEGLPELTAILRHVWS